MLQGLFKQSIFSSNLTEITPTHIHPMFQNKKASLGGGHWMVCEHIRLEINMQENIVALIIQHGN